MKETMALTRDGMLRALTPPPLTPVLEIDHDREDALVVTEALSSAALRFLSVRRVREADDEFSCR